MSWSVTCDLKIFTGPRKFSELFVIGTKRAVFFCRVVSRRTTCDQGGGGTLGVGGVGGRKKNCDLSNFDGGSEDFGWVQGVF